MKLSEYAGCDAVELASLVASKQVDPAQVQVAAQLERAMPWADRSPTQDEGRSIHEGARPMAEAGGTS